MNDWLPSLLRCPDCHGELSFDGDDAKCTACGRAYPAHGGGVELIGAKSVLDTSEIETQDRVSDHYEQARYKHAFSRAYHEKTLDQLIDIVPPRGTVLDDGCGNGVFLDHLEGRNFPIDRYVGVDISRGMLGHARRRLGDRPSAAVLRADATRLPFADATFDVVYARGLLHHLNDPGAGAREAARVLKPGGSLVTLDPNRSLVSDIPRRLANRTDHFDEGHKNFRAREVVSLLSPHLEVKRIEFVGYVAYPLLGFPDLINFGRLLPLDMLGPSLTKIDDVLARVPALRTLGWGLVAEARRR